MDGSLGDIGSRLGPRRVIALVASYITASVGPGLWTHGTKGAAWVPAFITSDSQGCILQPRLHPSQFELLRLHPVKVASTSQGCIQQSRLNPTITVASASRSCKTAGRGLATSDPVSWAVPCGPGLTSISIGRGYGITLGAKHGLEALQSRKPVLPPAPPRMPRDLVPHP